MSTFISFAFPGQTGFLVTDGAVWNSVDQTLVSIECKAFRAKRAALAVSGRGNAATVKEIAKQICEEADANGVEYTFRNLQLFADGLQNRPELNEMLQGGHFIVSGFVKGEGAMHRAFSTYDRNRTIGNVRAFEVWDPESPIYWSGTRMDMKDLETNGLMPRPTEPLPSFVRRAAVGMMEIMRGRPGISAAGESIWCVGGQVDLTTISDSGCKIETIRRWPDVIGQKIDPFRGAVPAAGNRAARRRLARGG